MGELQMARENFRVGEMDVSADIVFQRMKQHYPEDMKRFLAGAELCARSGSHEQVLYNLKVVACDALCAGMLAIRWEDDLKAGVGYFAQGADITDRFLDFGKRGFPTSAWLSHHLLYCNVLSNRFEQATALAEWTSTIVAPNPRLTDVESEAFGRLLALFILDRRDEFITVRQQCFNPPPRKLHPFWQWLTVYLDLYQAVLDRDQARFDELMQVREGACVKWSKKKAGGSRPEFIGGELSQFVFDFMGVGVAKIARHRGMRCDFDSTFLPKKVVEA